MRGSGYGSLCPPVLPRRITAPVFRHGVGLAVLLGEQLGVVLGRTGGLGPEGAQEAPGGEDDDGDEDDEGDEDTGVGVHGFSLLPALGSRPPRVLRSDSESGAPDDASDSLSEWGVKSGLPPACAGRASSSHDKLGMKLPAWEADCRACPPFDSLGNRPLVSGSGGQ